MSGGAMGKNFQDALLVLVFFYAVFRVYENGAGGVNLFILLCACVALISMILSRCGVFEKARKEKEAAMKQLEEEKKEKENQ